MGVSLCPGDFDPFLPPLRFLLDYLLGEFQRVPVRSSSTLHTFRLALYALDKLDDLPTGLHPLGVRFMRAVFSSEACLFSLYVFFPGLPS